MGGAGVGGGDPGSVRVRLVGPHSWRSPYVTISSPPSTLMTFPVIQCP